MPPDVLETGRTKVSRHLHEALTEHDDYVEARRAVADGREQLEALRGELRTAEEETETARKAAKAEAAQVELGNTTESELSDARKARTEAEDKRQRLQERVSARARANKLLEESLRAVRKRRKEGLEKERGETYQAKVQKAVHAAAVFVEAAEDAQTYRREKLRLFALDPPHKELPWGSFSHGKRLKKVKLSDFVERAKEVGYDT